jgi:hypothetical protein
MQNLSFALGAADDMVGGILESIEFIAAIEQQVLGYRQLAQGQVQARSFLAATALLRCGLKGSGSTIRRSTSESGRASPRAREPNRITVSGLASRTIVSTISRIRLSSSLCIHNTSLFNTTPTSPTSVTVKVAREGEIFCASPPPIEQFRQASPNAPCKGGERS